MFLPTASDAEIQDAPQVCYKMERILSKPLTKKMPLEFYIFHYI